MVSSSKLINWQIVSHASECFQPQVQFLVKVDLDEVLMAVGNLESELVIKLPIRDIAEVTKFKLPE